MENKTEQFLSKGAVREMTALSTSTSVNGSGVCQAAATTGAPGAVSISVVN
jgi:hypothetical protein